MKSLAAIGIATMLAISGSSAAHAVPRMVVKKFAHGGGSSAPWSLVCVFGSALGLIGSASAVYRTQSRELTSQEAATIAFTCGLGVLWAFRYSPPPPDSKPISVRN
jgi:hypothetical protein